MATWPRARKGQVVKERTNNAVATAVSQLAVKEGSEGKTRGIIYKGGKIIFL